MIGAMSNIKGVCTSNVFWFFFWMRLHVSSELHVVLLQLDSSGAIKGTDSSTMLEKSH